MESILFLAAPFLMCVALLGIHCYLGLHVLAREVIFVDLALAQVAAFGSVFSLLLGYDHHDVFTYFISLGATLVAAIFLTYANRFKDIISQEAIIGILYALASATIILLIDNLSHGAEHLKQSLIGSLLWVTWEDVVKVTLIYFLVGVIHFVFRRQLLKSSTQGKGSWIWDFVFYGLFGVVITSSVHYAGVLLVFSFLIVPSVLSSLFFKNWGSRLLFGWASGITLCLLGMALSFQMDLPSGALIVVVFTLCPVLAILIFPKKITYGINKK